MTKKNFIASKYLYHLLMDTSISLSLTVMFLSMNERSIENRSSSEEHCYCFANNHNNCNDYRAMLITLTVVHHHARYFSVCEERRRKRKKRRFLFSNEKPCHLTSIYNRTTMKNYLERTRKKRTNTW